MLDLSKKTTEELLAILNEYFVFKHSKHLPEGGILEKMQGEFGLLYNWIGWVALLYFEKTNADYIESVVADYQRNQEQRKVQSFLEDVWQ